MYVYRLQASTKSGGKPIHDLPQLVCTLQASITAEYRITMHIDIERATLTIVSRAAHRSKVYRAAILVNEFALCSSCFAVFLFCTNIYPRGCRFVCVAGACGMA